MKKKSDKIWHVLIIISILLLVLIAVWAAFTGKISGGAITGYATNCVNSCSCHCSTAASQLGLSSFSVAAPSGFNHCSGLGLSCGTPQCYNGQTVVCSDISGQWIELCGITGNPRHCAVCTSFTYSGWSTCFDGFKKRTVASASPAGCTGGTPSLVSSCTTENGLVAYWSFDSSDGSTASVAKDIIGGYDGTVNGASQVAGIKGEAYSFDGVNDNIQIGKTVLDDVFVSNNYAISTWVKINNCSDRRGYDSMIIQKWHSSGYNDNEFLLYACGSYYTNTKSSTFGVPSLHEWHNIVVSSNSGNVKIYVDGSLKANDTGHKSTATTSPLRIGNLWNDYYNFNGLIDEVRIWNRPLSDSEVSGLYQDSNPSSCAIKCTPGGTNAITPYAYSYPTEAVVGKPSGTINISSDNSGTFGYEFWWTYNYFDGTKKEICGCNLSAADQLSPEGVRIYSGDLTSQTFSIPLLINDTFGKTLRNVTLKTAAKAAGSRSQWASSDIVMNYDCTNACNQLGENSSVATNDKYQTCIRNQSSSCYIKSAVITCPPQYNLYNASSQQCYFGGGVTCTSTDSSGQPKFCFVNSSATVPHATPTGDNCVVGGFSCWACNAGNTWDELQAKCVKSNCNQNCTGTNNNQGICANASVVSGLSNGTVSSSYECCNYDSCYRCSQGFHIYNGTCVSDTCTGIAPQTTNGTIIGPNSTSQGMDWAYNASISSTSPAACRWKCADGYHNVTNDTFNGCVIGWGPCADYGGVCYTNQTTLANATAINGSCSGSDICYKCNAPNFNWNGSACISCTDTCRSNGGNCLMSQIDYANLNSSLTCCGGGSCYQCMSGYSWGDSTNSTCVCTSGCNYNNMCIPMGIRLMVDNQRKYCSSARKLEIQMDTNATCANNYECVTNLCNNQKCVSLATELQNNTNLLSQLIDLMRRLFGVSS